VRANNKDIDWGAVLQGDRFFALLHVRAPTYGPTYAFATHTGRGAAGDARRRP